MGQCDTHGWPTTRGGSNRTQAAKLRLPDDDNTKLKAPRLRPLGPCDESAWEKCPETGFWTPQYGYVVEARTVPPPSIARQVADSHAPQAVGHHLQASQVPPWDASMVSSQGGPKGLNARKAIARNTCGRDNERGPGKPKEVMR